MKNSVSNKKESEVLKSLGQLDSKVQELSVQEKLTVHDFHFDAKELIESTKRAGTDTGEKFHEENKLFQKPLRN